MCVINNQPMQWLARRGSLRTQSGETEPGQQLTYFAFPRASTTMMHWWSFPEKQGGMQCEE